MQVEDRGGPEGERPSEESRERPERPGVPADRAVQEHRLARDRQVPRQGRALRDARAPRNAAAPSSPDAPPVARPLPALRLQYDPTLPITAHRDEVIEAIRRHQVIVLCGATGSGKSTQLPKLCIEAGRGVNGVIGHTQPRRIAARALASRLAEETATTVGGTIGYKVRFNDRTGPDCRIKLMTDGILLKELESDRLLRRYDTLIIDEAHERSLNIDLLLGVLKQMLPRRPDLRLIVTSATIDPARFAAFFGGGEADAPGETAASATGGTRGALEAGVVGGVSVGTSGPVGETGGNRSAGATVPVIEVSGRSYPVEIRYRPLITSRDGERSAFSTSDSADDVSVAVAEDEDTVELTLPEGIIEAIRELDAPGRGSAFGQGSRGDVLVFLPGEKHIREAADALEKARLPNTEILPLFARLSTSDQERIFKRQGMRRIVLATNVAETSLTVPGIRFVIDSGLARISRYSVRGKVQRLPIERISKASADQRKGRCGREAEGICIRLYSEEDFGQREDFTPPEVLRTNLASVILRMAALGLGDPESFPFLDPPDTRLVNDGVRLLQELKAMDDDRRVTSLGDQIAGIPVDPRLGRMLLAASRQRCLTEMLIVAAFLEGQDPRERPSDAQQQASQKHALFADPRSDFNAVLNIWKAYHEQAAALSRNQLRKWCKEHYLSFLRMREWQDLHTQLSQSIAELKLKLNQAPANYTDLHQAILTGFLGSIGELDEKREYNGPRGMRFVVAPGTPLASKPPRWIVAGSIVETTRLYARMVAAVDPGWIEAAGSHLLKRTYSEPYWEAVRGYASAYESIALYGLMLASRRRVNYGAIAPKEARDMFIREALVDAPEEEHENVDEYLVASGGSGGGGDDPMRDAREAMGERGRSGRDAIGERGHGGRAAEAARIAPELTGADRNVAMADRSTALVSRRRDQASPARPRQRAVVDGEFFEANRRLRAEIEALEAKIRRRDVVVDEESQVEFYAARIPERVNSVAAFNHWRAETERTNPRLLYMSRADLMQRDAEEAGEERFPDALPVGANQLPLQYRFDPAESGDGMTLIVPEPLIEMVNAEQTAWLVPGLRLEKITAVFRALPKAQRKMLVPVPDFAKQALDDLAIEEARLGRLPGYHEWMAQWITQHVGAPIKASEVAALELPDHLRINFRVLDAEDRVIAEGRDLLAVKRKLFEVEQRARGEQGTRNSPGGARDTGTQVARNQHAGSHGGPGRGSQATHSADATGTRAQKSLDGRAALATGQAERSIQSPGGAPGQPVRASQQGTRGAQADSGGNAGASRGVESARGTRSAELGGLSLRDALAGLALGTNTPAVEPSRGGAAQRESARADSQSAPLNRAAAASHGQAASSNSQPALSHGQSVPSNRAAVASQGQAASSNRQAAPSRGQPTSSNRSVAAPGVQSGAPNHQPVQSRGQPAPTNRQPVASPGRNAPPAPQVRAASAPPPPPVHRQWDFGDLPESREVERNRLRLIVYPAVEDRGSGVALIEARNALAAESISRAGLVRLAMLALPQQAKYVHKRVADDRELVLLSGGLTLKQSLADALTQRAFRECFLPAEVPMPRTAQDFNKLLDNRRAQLSEVGDRLAGIITLTLKEWRAARTGLSGIRSGVSFADVVSEIDAQLQLLLPPDFIETTPRPWLDYLSRYLKAIARRIERLPPNVRRDAELSAKVRPFTTAMRSLMAQPSLSGVRPELDELRWMIEEFRVSLFAQELKTMIRVSEKRLEDQLSLAREAQR